MIGPRYIPTQLQNLNFEHDLTKHHRKLEQIHKDERKKRSVDKEGQLKSKLFEVREKGLKFHNSEKALAIEKDNELLLGRLVEISRKKPGVLAQVKSESNLPRTLNGPSRKREKNRIAAENEAFARRLLSQQPSFNPKKLESDYEKHHQRVKNMAKLAQLASPTGRKVRLPPIKYADVELAKGDKKAKNAKKEHKKKVDDDDAEVNQTQDVTKDDAKDVSPVKAQSKVDVPAKSIVVDNQPAGTQSTTNVVADDTNTDNKDALNKPVEDQNQANSAVNVDNKSQVLQDNTQVPKSGTDVDNNNAPKSGVVDPNSQVDKPVEEIKPVEEVVQNDQIQDDTKQE